MKSVRIRSFSGPNAGKYGPGKLQIQTLSRIAQLIFFLVRALFWRHTPFDVLEVELVCLNKCRQLSIFPNLLR